MSIDALRIELEEICGEEIASSVLRTSSGVPDQALFLVNFMKIAEAFGAKETARIFLEEKTAKLILPLLACSQYLTDILAKHSEIIDWLFLEGNYREPLDGDLLKEEIIDMKGQLSEEAEVSKFLRRVKAREIVRIALRDLGGLADMEETALALSDLAEASLCGATLFALSSMKKRYGAPLVQEEGAEVRECQFCVLALGKFGGRELNFSSDIDIMYSYEFDGGFLDSVTGDEMADGGGMTFHQFFIKVAEMVTRLIGEITGDGIVFRVDLRLRPDGTRGPLANSMRALETYYESWGQTWERAALIKARPVAGDGGLGFRVIKMLAPFVYRKFLDFVTVEEVKELKDRIDFSLKAKKEGMWDVKLGEGGIREVEFFIQSHQLIFGGKNPRLRESNSMKALASLREEGYLSPAEEESLADAYRFLRNLEHRIQMLRGMQTQVLPHDEDLRKVSYLMGFTDVHEFEKELSGKRKKVREIFGKLFAEEKREVESDVEPEVIGLLYGDMSPEDTFETLDKMGFAEPQSASKDLELLRSGPQSARMTQRARNYLRKIAPLLLAKVVETPAPDMALSNIDMFIKSIGARTTFYALLSENPRVIEPLVQLFGSSQYLSGYFINNLDLLDVLLRKGQSAVIKNKTEMRKELGEKLVLAEHFEDELGILRRYRNEEFLRIGIHKLGGNLSLEEFSFQLSALAEVSMGFTFFLAKREAVKKYGAPSYVDEKGEKREASLLVVGMGKLGGEELNFHSDLDIIFIFSHMGETDVAFDGRVAERKQITNQEFFAKVAQRFISNLSTVTKEGYVYKIDMRLRPSGSQGPLVTSFSAFKNYYEKDARIWERQALLKARVVVDERDFGKEVRRWISSYIYEEPLPPSLKSEISEIRGRMERELGKEEGRFHNLKFGKGGLVEVEFLVQYLQLRNGGKVPALRTQNTLKALFEFIREGILNEEEFRILDEGYRFLREIEISLRLVHDSSVERFLIDDRGILLLNMPSRAEFEKKYGEITGNIRSVYSKFLQI
jgi:glutamate-ammonia-ligase adenylyltransferase